MRIPQDERFRRERQRFALRFTCEHCALWNEVRERCTHDFPTEEHRTERYRSPSAELVFCKDFELV